MNQLRQTSLFSAAIFASTAVVSAFACTNPTGSEGQQIYNVDYKVMQYCDGTNWVAMAADGFAEAQPSDVDWLKSDGTSATAIEDDVYTLGRVGVGKVPGAPYALDVLSSAPSGQSVHISNGASDTTSIRFTNSVGSGLLGSHKTGMYISGGGSNVPQQFFISTAGNVGINTTSPSRSLHVNGSGIQIGTQTSTAYQPILMRRLVTDGTVTEASIGIVNPSGDLLIDNQNNNIILRTSAGDSIAVVSDTGFVGVGTTAPDRAFVVGGALKVSSVGNVNVEADVLFDAQGLLAAESNLYLFSDSLGTGFGDIILGYGAETVGATPGLRLSNTTGNVRIGTGAANSRLSVNGLPSGTGAGSLGTPAGAVCITTAGDMYIDTDGVCS